MKDPAAPVLSAADTQILRTRAKALARVPEPVVPAETLLEVLEFRLGHERYAVETCYVQEVFPLMDMTPLPCTPAFVLGIVNLRGRIVAVLELRQLFSLPEPNLPEKQRIILVRVGDLEFGLLADRIVGVNSVRRDRLQPALPTQTGIQEDYLKGVTSEHLVVLDLARIAADPKIIVHDEADEPVGPST